jgi:hypothetical protein
MNFIRGEERNIIDLCDKTVGGFKIKGIKKSINICYRWS